MGRRCALVGAAILCAVATASCGRSPAGTAAAREHVVVGVSLLRISQPVFLAVERGLFRKHGLDVELVTFDTAQPLADEIAAGRIDAGGYVAFPILFGMPGAAPRLRVTGAIVEDDRHPLSYLLVRNGSGLHGVSSLRGRRIGILPTMAYRRWLEAILARAGLSTADATIVPVAPSLEVDALAGGGVDALFTGDPMATAALARRVAAPATDAAEVPRALGSPFVFGTFAVADELATRRPAAARALRDALDEAIAILDADPAAGRAAMRPFLRAPERPFVDRYPPSRYLRADELAAPALDRALRLAGSPLRARDVVLP